MFTLFENSRKFYNTSYAVGLFTTYVNGRVQFLMKNFFQGIGLESVFLGVLAHAESNGVLSFQIGRIVPEIQKYMFRLN